MRRLLTAAGRHALLVGALALFALGCSHRGGGWDEAPPTVPDDGRVSLVLLGDPAPGRTAGRVANELEHVLEAERAAGRRAIVLWLGNQVHPDCESPTEDRGLQLLHWIVYRHVAQGGASYGVSGHRDLRCDTVRRGEHLQKKPQPEWPWSHPQDHYVLRIRADGSTRVVSHCGGEAERRCSLEPPRPDDLVDLVFVDLAAWFYPVDDPEFAPRQLGRMAELDALMASVQASSDKSPPRILVSHVPLESRGVHGQGGMEPKATTHNFPPSVQDTVLAGAFAGVVSAHERNLQATADLEPWLARSYKRWPPAPLFMVVSGAAGQPDAHAPFTARQVPYAQGIALEPDLISSYPGFAHIVLGPRDATVVLHARKGGKWREAGFTAPLRPEDAPHERKRPEMNPCLRCDGRQGAADGPKHRANPDEPE